MSGSMEAFSDERVLETLVGGLRQPAFVFHDDGTLRSANAGAVELLGKDALQMESRTFDGLFSPLPVRKGSEGLRLPGSNHSFLLSV